MTTPVPAGSWIGADDLHRFVAGEQTALYDHLGAHPATVDGTDGVWFSVWAPAATMVRVVGDFNAWDGDALTPSGSSGVWEGFVGQAAAGQRYKFEITTAAGEVLIKADPMAFQAELPPATASVIHQPGHVWRDDEWMADRARTDGWARPLTVYEVHLGSWRHGPANGDRSRTYRELAEDLATYVTDMGFTHVELMPVMAHPFGGSWGYQVTSYFAPSPRWGSPDDFAALVDHLHGAGVGVILDWVPAHFPRDEWSLVRFDGTALYEHADPLRSDHPDWGTLEFDYSRRTVRNFLLSNARFWIERYHVDGLRVDAVASMLYLDYSRGPGEWVPNERGGREDLDAVGFVRELNETVHATAPGVLSIAEESTAWPGVSRATADGGLGFGLKWNLGWMHDTLSYFAEDPIRRRFHHHRLTFALIYAFSENFLLPLSHDEVVHGKGSLLTKMPGDRRHRFANLRALYGLMWAHPGKQLLFMGGELAQEREWSHDRDLDWHLLEEPDHAGVQRLVRDLNHQAHARPALWAADFDPAGFTWLVVDDADHNVVAFLRHDPTSGAVLAAVANLSPVPRPAYRLGLPQVGGWRVVIDTDDPQYGGSGTYSERDPVVAVADPAVHGQSASAPLDLSPLAVLWLEPEA